MELVEDVALTEVVLSPEDEAEMLTVERPVELAVLMVAESVGLVEPVALAETVFAEVWAISLVEVEPVSRAEVGAGVVLRAVAQTAAEPETELLALEAELARLVFVLVCRLLAVQLCHPGRQLVNY